MKLKAFLTMICATALLTACNPLGRSEPLFSDVARKPPLTRSETVDYLVTNDRPMAVWIEEMASACDEYGCI